MVTNNGNSGSPTGSKEAPSPQTQTSSPLQDLVSRVRGNSGQMTDVEYGILIGTILRSAPCNLLVFGQGNDSDLWTYLNRQGRTVFLENVKEWFRPIRGAESFLVQYPGLVLPECLTGRHWNLIIVDGPLGWKPEHPGRKESIQAASELVAVKGLVFVHDYDRPAERLYCDEYFGTPTYTIDRMAIFHPR